ncbi:hypothetical protein [Amycolatopsis azurea]|uniref:hypothetical protein n=1 Tax=Amycolatopsis azurea TaxID=36819 RepID=UPI001FD7E830|nr:hypothetical protein [Amycolatopsis azurea]
MPAIVPIDQIDLELGEERLIRQDEITKNAKRETIVTAEADKIRVEQDSDLRLGERAHVISDNTCFEHQMNPP